MATFTPARLCYALGRASEEIRKMTEYLQETGDYDCLAALSDALDEEGNFDMKSVKPDHNYLILTVTHYFVGRIVENNFTELVIDHASWVPETGQFSQIMASGQLAEADAAPPGTKIHINSPTIVAAIEWKHKLPTAKTGN